MMKNMLHYLHLLEVITLYYCIIKPILGRGFLPDSFHIKMTIITEQKLAADTDIAIVGRELDILIL